MNDEVFKIVIVGAGVGGLATAKYALGSSIGPLVILEQKEDLGGLWNPEAGYSWNTMIANNSKYNCSFMGFPLSKDAPIYPGGKDFFLYLKAYAKQFGIDKRTLFGCRVKEVQKMSNGLYEITYEQNS